MPSRRSGNRYTLLLSRHVWDRLWGPTCILGLILGIAWWQAGTDNIPFIQTANNLWVLFGAVITLSIGIFALLARNMNYIQTFPSYFRIVTPFLRLNIAYRRIRSIRPADMMKLFPPNQQSRAKRQFLAPFYANPGLAIELTALPISKPLLRLFFPPNFFLPKAMGFVIVVADWMNFSTELESRICSWQAKRRQNSQ
jgi:hypothetical protein